MKSIHIIFFLFLISASGFAQNFKVSIIKTEAKAFPYLISSVQVYDSDKEPITGLTAKDFVAKIDGKDYDSMKVSTYKETGRGVNIMLCLDISGTMAGTPLATTKKAILKFIDDMRGEDKLGLIGVADDAVLISDFSGNKEYLKDKVRGLTTSGTNTALYYGAHKGLKMLIDNKDDVAKIMMLIGDGKNESQAQSYTEDDVINEAKAEGIPIFTIGYSRIDRSYLQSLERISEKTNGTFYDSPNDDQLDKQYQKLYRQILNIYIAGYFVCNLAGDGQEHNNVITVSYKGSTKTTSSKFQAPAGAKQYSKITNEEKKDWLTYVLIGAGVLVLGGAGFFFVSKNNKKKQEAERIRKQGEQRKLDEIQSAARAKEEELQKKLAEATKPKEDSKRPNPNSAAPDNQKPNVPINRDEKTMIMSGGGASISNNGIIRLEISVGELAGSRFDIDSNGATIGRAAGNSIVIKDSTLSSRHAKISFINGLYILEDLGSSNGTFINGVQIQSQMLVHNDTFKLGKCEGTVQIIG